MRLIRHTLYNLLGLGLPLVVAVFCIPVLVTELGAARFGLLTLIWAVVGYFGLFDLGLGRALTQQLAVALANNDHKGVGPLVATATMLMVALGIFAGLLLAFLAPWGVGLIQAVPDQLEAMNALLLMALAMPAIVLTSGFRGVLEARHAFGIINAIRLPMGLFTYFGPVLVVMYGSTRLDVVAAVLAGGRVVACALYAWYAWHVLPESHGGLNLRRSLIRPLCATGGWMTVTNIIVPLMGYLDRFLLGVATSAKTVAYYVAPQELTFKLTILPSAITFVLFPVFSKSGPKSLPETSEYLMVSAKIIALVCVPMVVLFALLSSEILLLWIGKDFSLLGADVMTIMACGMIVNSYAFLPVTWLQASGNSKVVAYIHLAELIVFMFVLWIAVLNFGALGAATAWVFRVCLDALLLWTVVAITEGEFAKLSIRLFLESLFIAGIVYCVAKFEFGLPVRIGLTVFVFLASGLLLSRVLNNVRLLGVDVTRK